MKIYGCQFIDSLILYAKDINNSVMKNLYFKGNVWTASKSKVLFKTDVISFFNLELTNEIFRNVELMYIYHF